MSSDKVKVTMYLTKEAADALQAASLAAGGYGAKSAIVERALRRELGLQPSQDTEEETSNVRTHV